MEDHSRIIVHIDIDCFYAQVEMIQNVSLQEKPLGIQQKNIVVTSNYIAREYGIKKCMLITEAKKLCPNLVLVNGEDLYKYRQMSYKVTSLLQTFSETIERLGLDENFIDVTDLVYKKLKGSNNVEPVGFKFGKTETLCDCGCTEKISVGSQIAEEIRTHIYQELHLTSCAGIAHNKLLAKIVGSKNKPNKQTFVFPNNATELMLSLETVNNIPWIGTVTAEQLSKINITKVNELQNCTIGQLKTIFGSEKAECMWNSSFGIDNTPVKRTGKPHSIGLEDSCKGMTSEQEVEDKLRCLLKRLIILVKEDDRIPKTIKLTVRKLDDIHPQSGVRETRQCNINLSIEDEVKIMCVIMTLFKKLVDTKKKFVITLVGVSFTKFEEKTNIKNTLTNFFTGKKVCESVKTFKQNENEMISLFKQTSELRTKTDLSQGDNSVKTSIMKKSILPNSHNVTLPNPISPMQLSTAKIICPPHLNEEVFRELPTDMQEEIWNDYKRKRDTSEDQRPHKKVKTNSILNYVIRGQK